MIKIIRKIIILFAILAALAQSLAIYKSNEIVNSKPIVVQSNISTQKDLLDFYEELNCLKESNIISANKIDGRWYIKLQIQGDRDYILGELSKLQIYNINNYIIKHDSKINEVIVEISDKNNV